MPVKFNVNVKRTAAWDNRGQPIMKAAIAALRETADNAVKEGRQNIGAAGPGFRRRKWQTGLKFRMRKAGQGAEAKAVIFHTYGIAGVFEHGATIQGKPMLWIPTEPGGPPASRSGKKLTSATIGGRPMLFDANDRDRHRQPLYIGVRSVHIPRKFRIFEIVKKHVKQFASIFSKHFKPGI